MSTQRSEHFHIRTTSILKKAVKDFCSRKGISETFYIESLIRSHLKRQNINTEPVVIKNGDGWENNKWTGKLEDMPL